MGIWAHFGKVTLTSGTTLRDELNDEERKEPIRSAKYFIHRSHNLLLDAPPAFTLGQALTFFCLPPSILARPSTVGSPPNSQQILTFCHVYGASGILHETTPWVPTVLEARIVPVEEIQEVVTVYLTVDGERAYYFRDGHDYAKGTGLVDAD
jgi:hypothetical protein